MTGSRSSLPPRAVYRHAELRRLIDPRRIAIVGVSSKPLGFGTRTRECLRHFKGEVMLVNPRHDSIGGEPCYPSVKALPQPPDCVVVAVAKEDVEAVLRDCAEGGAGGAIVYASGFAEVGKPETVAMQQRLTAFARESGLRIAGPNMVGMANFMTNAVMMFFPEPLVPPDYMQARVGLISQTGSLGIAMSQAIESGTAFSHMLTSGNSCDVDVADLIAYLAEDDNCRAIACLFEGVSDPERFLEAGRLARQKGKPLLIHKIATGNAGAIAAKSHTGTLAGSSAVYRAAFEKIGAIVVDEMEGLVEAATFFAKMPSPKAPGVAVISGSGGATVISADKAEKHGVSLPQPAEKAAAVLREQVPEFGSARNPCDVTAQVNNNPQSFVLCLDALMSDPAYGAMVVPNGHASQLAIDRALPLGNAARKHGKAACIVSLAGWLDGPGSREIEMDPGIALFRSLDRCFAMLGQWVKRGPGNAPLDEAPAPRRSTIDAQSRARSLLAAVRSNILTEREGKQVLAAYGIPVATEALATTAGEAARLAADMGFPVALKVESPALPHKTEAGGVRLNLRGEDDVRSAFEDILAAVRRHDPSAPIHGVLVQKMAEGRLEIIVGAHLDELFGPVVVAGIGGTLVELLKDTQVALAPVDMAQARAMLTRLRGAELLSGFRGQAPVDLDAVAEVICRVSELAVDLRDVVASIDVNPLVCSGATVVAVDAMLEKPR